MKKYVVNSDLFYNFILITAGVIIPIILALKFQALTHPFNDDWGFKSIVFNFHKHGTMELNGWESMTFVGQVFLALPFIDICGSSSWVPNLVSIILAVIGIVALYQISRKFLSKYWSFFSVMIFISFIGVMPSSVSFMTDIPCIATAMISLWLGLKSIETNSKNPNIWLIGSGLFGFLSFSIREFGLIPFLAIVTIHLVVKKLNRTLLIIETILIGGVSIYLYIYDTKLTGYPITPYSITTNNFWVLLSIFFSFSFFFIPVLIVSVSRLWKLRNQPHYFSGFFVSFLLGILLFNKYPENFFIGNYFSNYGIGDNGLNTGIRHPLFSHLLLYPFAASAIFSGSVIMAFCFNATHKAFKQSRREINVSVFEYGALRSVLLLSFVLSICSLLVHGILFGFMFDRFFWPALFFATILFLSGDLNKKSNQDLCEKQSNIPSLFVLIINYLIAALFMINIFSYDQGRWNAGLRIHNAGVANSEIDAGFEWVGLYSGGAVLKSISRGGYSWYSSHFTGPKLHAVVSDSKLDYPGIALIGVTQYQLYGFFGSVPLYLYEIH